MTSVSDALLDPVVPVERKREKEPHFQQLDGLRAVAVILVIAHHAFGWKNADVGSFGVRLFFVLSGFLITGILVRCKARIAVREATTPHILRQFYCRRFLRIFPAYYVFLIAGLLLDRVNFHRGIAWHATYLTNFYYAHKGQWALQTSHLWSLSVEEQFYLVWPLVYFLLPKAIEKKVILGLIAIAVLSRVVLSMIGVNAVAVHVLPLSCVDSLACGILLAIAPKLHVRGSLAMIAVIAAIVSRVWSFQYPYLNETLAPIADAIAAGWIIHRAIRGFPGFIGRLLVNPAMMYIGTISYGIYLYHAAVIEMFKRWMPHFAGEKAVMFVGAALISIIIASVSWIVLERPINGLKRFVPYK